MKAFTRASPCSSMAILFLNLQFKTMPQMSIYASLLIAMKFLKSINYKNSTTRLTGPLCMPKQGISVFIRLIETAINRRNVLEQHVPGQNVMEVGTDHWAVANGLSLGNFPVVRELAIQRNDHEEVFDCHGGCCLGWCGICCGQQFQPCRNQYGEQCLVGHLLLGCELRHGQCCELQ